MAEFTKYGLLWRTLWINIVSRVSRYCLLFTVYCLPLKAEDADSFFHGFVSDEVSLVGHNNLKVLFPSMI